MCRSSVALNQFIVAGRQRFCQNAHGGSVRAPPLLKSHSPFHINSLCHSTTNGPAFSQGPPFRCLPPGLLKLPTGCSCILRQWSIIVPTKKQVDTYQRLDAATHRLYIRYLSIREELLLLTDGVLEEGVGLADRKEGRITDSQIVLQRNPTNQNLCTLTPPLQQHHHSVSDFY